MASVSLGCSTFLSATYVLSLFCWEERRRGGDGLVAVAILALRVGSMQGPDKVETVHQARQSGHHSIVSAESGHNSQERRDADVTTLGQHDVIGKSGVSIVVISGLAPTGFGLLHAWHAGPGLLGGQPRRRVAKVSRVGRQGEVGEGQGRVAALAQLPVDAALTVLRGVCVVTRRALATSDPV